MNVELLRTEIFALMLKQEKTNNLDEFVRFQFEIEAKIEPLVNLTGLNKETIETMLGAQYTTWLSEGGSARLGNSEND